MSLSGYASTGNPYDDAGGDWLPAGGTIAPSIAAKPDGSNLFNSFPNTPVSTGSDAASSLVGKLGSLGKSSIIPSMGIPSISASGGQSTSGDSENKQDAAFQYNGAFQVGGSGSLSQSSDSGQGGGSADNKILLYAGIGVIALIALAVLVRR